MFLLYLGPEVLMPIASVLAAIGGAILMFWNKVVGLFARIMGRPRPEPQEDSPEESPEPVATHASDTGA